MEALRLYTENKNSAEIVRLLNSTFSAYSLFTVDGVWRSQHESMLCVELLTDSPDVDEGKLESVARAIKAGNNQEVILLTRQPVMIKFV